MMDLMDGMHEDDEWVWLVRESHLLQLRILWESLCLQALLNISLITQKNTLHSMSEMIVAIIHQKKKEMRVTILYLYITGPNPIDPCVSILLAN